MSNPQTLSPGAPICGLIAKGLKLLDNIPRPATRSIRDQRTVWPMGGLVAVEQQPV
jgi:hypothetical protein